MIRWRNLSAALLIFVVAAALRIAVAAPGLADGGFLRFSRPDTPGYLIPAVELARDGHYPGSGRVPGFSALAALVFQCGDFDDDDDGIDPLPLVVVLSLIGAAAAVPVFFAGLCHSFRAGVLAGGLYAFNLTAVANAPMLLSDTFFGLAAALQFWMFMLFRKHGRGVYFLLMVLTAALGALIRPINLLWIFPALALLACRVDSNFGWRRKLFWGCAGAVLFAAVLTPWMARNAACGAGFTLDTNTGAMYHQNGAMLLAEINDSDFETEKARLMRENADEFADLSRYPDEASRESYRMRRYRELILAYPLIWLRQSASWRMLLPDAPTFWELCGVTTSGRGTMGILAKHGVGAAVRHYFGGRTGLLFITVLLLLPTLLLYSGALGKLICDICRLKTNWYEILMFLAFVEYYLLLPGAITAPRYQIPALPMLCVMAAVFLLPERKSEDAAALDDKEKVE